MDKYQKKLEQLLEMSGAKVVRRKKHIVYELANGRMVVLSSTPSDANVFKNAISDVRRTAAIPVSNDTFCSPFVTEGARTKKKARFRAPARDRVVKDDPGIIIPSLEGSGVRERSSHEQHLQFASVSELIFVADEVDSFWGLNPDGRARVLMKLGESFAKVDVIGTRSYKTSFRGFEWFMAKSPRRDPLLALWGFDWQMPITRSVLMKTADDVPKIIDTDSKRVLNGTPQISLILVKSGDELEERAEIETVGDEPELELNSFVFHHFIHTSKMPARRLSFVASPEWLDPRLTRPVVSDMLRALALRRK